MCKNKKSSLFIKVISVIMVMILCGSIAIMAAEGEEYSKEELKKRILDEAVLIEKEFDDISEISLSEDLWSDCVIIGSGDKFKVKLYEWVENEYTITVNNGILEIENNSADIYMKTSAGNTPNWVNAILQEMKRSPNPESAESGNRVIEITLPEDFILDDLEVDFNIGGIKIENCEIKNIDTRFKVGNIEINNSKIDLINCRINVGNIEINNSKIDFINCRINVGNGVLDNTNSEECYIEIDVGGMEINNSEFKSIDCRIDVGNVVLYNTNSEECYVEINVGDFEITSGDIENLTVNVSKGNINIKLPDIKKYRIILKITKFSKMKVNEKEYTYNDNDSKRYVLNPTAKNKMNLSVSHGECIITTQD